MSTQDRVVTLTLPPSFGHLLESIHKQHGITSNAVNEPCLALDPGETTGVAEFDGDTKINVFQKDTREIGPSYEWLYDRLHAYDPRWEPPCYSMLRVEDYRVYEWKAQDHSWSPVHTIQWIGAIRVAAHLSCTPLSFCMAQHAKKWWTDGKLNHFGINPKGLKHGRDALRHLLYYLCFPTKADGT